MRLTTIIILSALMQVSAATFGQKVTLKGSSVKIESLFREIRQQTGYDVLVFTKNFKTSKTIDIDFKNAPLAEVMDRVLLGTQLGYTIEDKTVVVKEKEPSLLDKLSTVISNIVRDLNVKGRVVDQDGKPLPNASIRIKGRNTVINTNQNGEFEIKNVADDAVLLISYVGFRTLELPLKDAVMPLEIKLNVATGELEEVKVVYNTGYQELNKERATGSFVQVNNTVLNRSVSTNILDRLKGVVSGLNFQSTPGGRNNGIMIRGNSTINANQNPLIVVDGFPYDESEAFFNIVNNLNPNDIETITVLKDAAAASIWGARAGNGVIVINTKKGMFNQQSKVQFSSNFTIGDKPNLFYTNKISSPDAIAFEKKRFADSLYNEYDDSYPSFNYFPSITPVAEILLAVRRGDLNQEQADAQLAAMSNIDSRNDISRYLYQKSLNQQYAISLSGGSDKFNYYSSIGYDHNKSSLIGDNYNRLNIRYDNTYRPAKGIELSGYINYIQSKQIDNSIAENINNISPYARLSNNGSPLDVILPNNYRSAYIDTASYPGLLDWHYRPLEELALSDKSNQQVDNRFGFSGKYTVIPGLTAEIKYQYQKITNHSRVYYNPKSYEMRNLINLYMQVLPDKTVTYPVPNDGMLVQTNSNLITNSIRGQLNYNRVWSDNSTLVGLVGLERREVTSFSSSDGKYGYDIKTGTFNTAMDYVTRYTTRFGSTALVPNSESLNSTVNRYISYFGNAAYTYKGKYTLSMSARMDGSNFFGIKSNQRVTPLWSAGILWNIGKENFYDIALFPELKLRATYGYNGNTYNSVTAYPTIRHEASVLNTIIKIPYAGVMTPGNPRLRWERIRMINLGIDIGSTKNRISGSIEYYQKKGLDLIGNIITEPTSGFVSFMGNQASIKGRGVDITLNTVNIKEPFSWQSNFLFSYNSDKVIDYEGSSSNVLNYLGGRPYVGKPIYNITSYRWAGLDPNNGNPRVYIADNVASYTTANASAKLEDLTYQGSATPLFFGSLRNTLLYKNFSVSFNILYKLDYYFRRSSIDYVNLIDNWTAHGDYALRWKKPGDEIVTNVPSISNTDNSVRNQVYRFSDILVENGDHIRLQDVRLSYDLNATAFKKFPIQHATFFVYANNLGILWRANKQNIDPDYGDTTIPNPRSISIGLTINLSK